MRPSATAEMMFDPAHTNGCKPESVALASELIAFVVDVTEYQYGWRLANRALTQDHADAHWLELYFDAELGSSSSLRLAIGKP